MPAPFTTTKYVDPALGSDANDGNSPATAYRTLNQARAATTTGRNRIRCKRGTVEVRTATFYFRNGLGRGGEFVFDSYGDADAPFQLLAGAGVQDIAWMLGGSQFIEVNDWIFDGQSQNTRPFNLQSNSANVADIIFRRCGFHRGGDAANTRSSFTVDSKTAGFNVRRLLFEECDFTEGASHGLAHVGDVQGIVRRCRAWGNGKFNGAHGFSSLEYRETLTGWGGAGPVYNKATANVPLQVKTSSATYPMLVDAGATSTPAAGQFGYTGGVLYIHLGGVNPSTLEIISAYTSNNFVQYELCEAWGNLAYQPYPYVEGAGFQIDDFARGAFIGCYSHDNQGPGFSFNIGANKGVGTGLVARRNGRFGVVANSATGLLLYNLTLEDNARNLAGSSDNSELTIQGGSAAQVRNALILTRKSYGIDVGANSVAGSSVDKAIIHGASISAINGAVSATNVDTFDPRPYLNGDLLIKPTVDIGGVPMRNPLDGAGVWVQGGRTFDGAPLVPGRVPIGARRCGARLPDIKSSAVPASVAITANEIDIGGAQNITISAAGTLKTINSTLANGEVVSIKALGVNVTFDETGNLELGNYGTSYVLRPLKRAVFVKWSGGYSLIKVVA